MSASTILAVASPSRSCLTLIDPTGRSIDVPDDEVPGLVQALAEAYGVRTLVAAMMAGQPLAEDDGGAVR